MTQHTKHTPGPWYVGESIDGKQRVFAGIHEVASVKLRQGDRKLRMEEIVANRYLIAEAGTVATECGLTPRQLLDQRNELLEAVIAARQLIDDLVDKFPDHEDRSNGYWASYRDQFDQCIWKAEASNV